ncbi:MAG TPA: hypothetical protein VEW94_11055 [Chloroflexia bacterium]|nr:hypothetical protein [Chloroflexia bacterium]
MKDDNSDKEAPVPSRGKRVLGKLPKSERDSEPEPVPEGTFGAQSASRPDIEPAGTQPRKGSKPPPRASHRRTPRTEASDGDKLALPEDALVAMRRSGGLRFTSKSVVIYRDGRVATEGTGYGTARRAPAKRLDDEEFAELYRALDMAWGQESGARDQGPEGETESFPGQPLTSGRQNPDGYAYEIAARTGRHTYATEVFDGSIPEQLAPLIKILSRYMRPARQARD